MDAWLVWALIIGVIALVALFVRSRFKKAKPFSEPQPSKPDLEALSDAYQKYGAASPRQQALGAYKDDHGDWMRRKADHDKQYAETKSIRTGLGAIAGFFGSIALFLFVMSLFVVVGTNKVGIMTAAGKPTGAYSNGFHGKNPWEIKTEFDGTRQFLRFDGKGNDESDLEKKTFPCIQVKLDGQATACLSGVISWQMKADTPAEKKNAVELFKTYRTFERLTKNFVYSSSRVALGKVFAGHNPLIKEKNQSLGELNQLSLDELKRQFGSELNIMSVDLAVPNYDDATDKSIADVQAQLAKTRLAAEEEQTNLAKSKANKALEASVQDPRVNQANCIDVAKQNHMEPGYCMMGGNSVIVDTGGNKN